MFGRIHSKVIWTWNFLYEKISLYRHFLNRSRLIYFSISSCVSFSKLYFSKTHLSCLIFWHKFISIISFYFYLVSIFCNNVPFLFLILVICFFFLLFLVFLWFSQFYLSISITHLFSNLLIYVLMYVISVISLPLFYTPFS